MKISGKEYAASVSKKGKVIANFTANWCHDCNVVSATYEKLSSELAIKIAFFEIDTDEEPELEKAQGVRRIPTFILFADGKEVSRFSEPTPLQLEHVVRAFANS